MTTRNGHVYETIRDLRAAGETVLPPWHLKVLLAVCELCRDRHACTLREISDHLGFASRSSGPAAALANLKRHGLVAFDPSKGRTIRPLVRLVALEEVS